MNLNSIQSTGRALPSAAAPARQPEGGFDVTISDGGVAVEGNRPKAPNPDQADAVRPAVEARLMTAIAAPQRGTAAVRPTALATSGVADEVEASAPASPPAGGRALGMYTGRGRVATMPREGLAGQLIDVTG